MNKTLLFSIPLCVGLTVSGSVFAQVGECDPQGAKANSADCKAMIRAEVKKELEKLGLATKGAGDCPNVAAGSSKRGIMRTRQQVRKEAKEAIAAGNEIDLDELDECPQ